MMNNYALNNPYLKNSVVTAPSEQLLIMLYDGAIKFVKLSIEATRNKDYDSAHKHNMRVQDIVTELMVTLNFDYPISKNLYALYDYFNFQLTEANVKKDIAPLEEVLSHLTELRQVWTEAAKKVKANVK